MTAWPKNELQKLADNDDLHISPLREDGKTYGTPTWIWSVVVDGALQVRAYNGQNSRWVSSSLAPESRPYQCCRYDERSQLRPGQW